MLILAARSGRVTLTEEARKPLSEDGQRVTAGGKVLETITGQFAEDFLAQGVCKDGKHLCQTVDAPRRVGVRIS